MRIEDLIEMFETTSIPQCKFRLTDSYGAYCALGLLHEKLGRNCHREIDKDWTTGRYIEDDCGVDIYDLSLPFEFRHYKGLEKEESWTIDLLNDEGLDFRQIASVLRYNLQLACQEVI